METIKIKEALESIGYNLLDRGKFWHTSAVFRNGDNKTALQIYKDSGVWKDYVSQTGFMPFKKLLELSLKTNDESIISQYMEEEDFLVSKSNKSHKIEMDKIYDENGLKKLLPHFSFYEKKGISTDTLRFFKCGLATAGKMYQRIVFPIYNEYSQIHGFAGRDVSTSVNDKPKWKHIGKKTGWIYPYYINQEYFSDEIAKNDSSIIIVESIGDMLNLFDKGFKNVLVSFGLDLSPSLICFLVYLCPKNIVLSFNNDKGKEVNRGLNASIKSYLKLLSYFDTSKVKICLPTKNDFGEMNQSEIDDWRIKLNKILKNNQKKQILEFIPKIERNINLSKQLISNKKYLTED